MGCEIFAPTWLGSVLFNLSEFNQPLQVDMSIDFEPKLNRNIGPENELKELSKLFLDKEISTIELMGAFQYHTSSYTKHRQLFFNNFRFRESLENQVDNALLNMGLMDKQVICVHLRRGDYLNFDKKHPLFWGRSFEATYRALSDILLSSFSNGIVYICSDDIEYCERVFINMNIPHLTFKNIFSDLDQNSQLMVDFMMMVRSNVLLISNSSLSFAAAMLNKNSRLFLRPCPKEDRYISFDPWNSHVLLPQTPYQFN